MEIIPLQLIPGVGFLLVTLIPAGNNRRRDTGEAEL
jgi:hypothetical protein